MKTFNCYYINLQREDKRNIQIKQELEKLFEPSVITRVEGFISNIKGLGCSLSHIRCINDFIQSDKDFALIFEDDFQLELTPEETLKAISQAMEENANLFLLGYHSILIDLVLEKRKGFLCTFSNGQMACGYMVSRSYAPKLLANFKNSSNMLSMTKNYEHYALDQYWKKLQVDEGVYACVPRCGKQRASYSSIENMFVDYEGFCYGVIISNQESFDINLPFQYKVIDGKNIKQDIESILQTHSNVDYIFFTDNVGINVKDVVKYFKLFAIHKLPYISFENNLFISKKYLNMLYEESIINNFQDIIKRYSD